MRKYYRLQDIYKLSGQKILFDANILIFVFGNLDVRADRYQLVNDYSKAVVNLLNMQDIEKYITFEVLSEVFNVLFNEYRKAYIRNVQRKSCTKKYEPQSLKEFRKTPEGKKGIEDTNLIIRDILQLFELIIIKPDTEDILHGITEYNIDFKDVLYYATCKQKKLILITDDLDFKCTDLDILTGNEKYFN